MSSEPLRGPQKDHLLRSQNSAFIHVVADAVGGASVPAHEAALRRVEPASTQLVSKRSSSYELQCDWAHKKTVPDFIDVFEARIPRRISKDRGLPRFRGVERASCCQPEAENRKRRLTAA